MTLEGGCYCGAVRYRADGEPMLRGECFCRECQYISGGNSNLVMAMPKDGFAITKGETTAYARPDLDTPVSREFCGRCGTHLITRAPGFPAGVMVKIGTLDDPAQFGGPTLVVFACDKMNYHRLPSDIPVYEKFPG